MHESVKYRLVGAHVETQKGDIETGSPYGSTDKYSCLRYEEEVDGNVVTIIDAMAGVIKYKGKTYSDRSAEHAEIIRVNIDSQMRERSRI